VCRRAKGIRASAAGVYQNRTPGVAVVRWKQHEQEFARMARQSNEAQQGFGKSSREETAVKMLQIRES